MANLDETNFTINMTLFSISDVISIEEKPQDKSRKIASFLEMYKSPLPQLWNNKLVYTTHGLGLLDLICIKREPQLYHTTQSLMYKYNGRHITMGKPTPSGREPENFRKIQTLDIDQNPWIYFSLSIINPAHLNVWNQVPVEDIGNHVHSIRDNAKAVWEKAVHIFG